MLTIALCCNLLIGYWTRRTRAGIRCSSGSNPDCGADIIDNPRGGIIRVLPENLVTHSQSFHV